MKLSRKEEKKKREKRFSHSRPVILYLVLSFLLSSMISYIICTLILQCEKMYIIFIHFKNLKSRDHMYNNLMPLSKQIEYFAQTICYNPQSHFPNTV